MKIIVNCKPRVNKITHKPNTTKQNGLKPEQSMGNKLPACQQFILCDGHLARELNLPDDLQVKLFTGLLDSIFSTAGV